MNKKQFKESEYLKHQQNLLKRESKLGLNEVFLIPNQKKIKCSDEILSSNASETLPKQGLNESDKIKVKQNSQTKSDFPLEMNKISKDNKLTTPLKKKIDSEDSIKTLNSRLKSICFFAVKNKRKRYFLPSQQNFFIFPIV